MNSVLRLSFEERVTIFRNTAQKMGVHEAIIEKDYWVCFVLDYLFNKSQFRDSLTFKGGTSLSKCFGLINRFSEDIDLILDWRLLDYGQEEPWLERTKNQQDKFNKNADLRAESFLVNKFLPVFRSDLSEMIGAEVMAEIDSDNAQTINFHYPRVFSTESILQEIRLEIGALAAWTPAIRKSVTPYIFEYYPHLSTYISAEIITSTVERTFWEKVTILHHEANRPEDTAMPMRYSRHYYDLYSIGQSDYKVSALKQLNLLQKVVLFKMKFYPRAWAKYEEAVPGSIKLLPPAFRIQALQNDYTSMAEMLFAEYPSFDALMESIEKLENEINQLFPVPKVI